MKRTYRSEPLTELEMATAVLLVAYARAGLPFPPLGEVISRAKRIRVPDEIVAIIEAADTAPFDPPPGRPSVKS